MNQNREMPDWLGVVKGLGDRSRAGDLEMADFISRSVRGLSLESTPPRQAVAHAF